MLTDSTTLVLREGTQLIIEDSAVVYVECGSRIDTADATNIVRNGTGKVIYQNCGGSGDPGNSDPDPTPDTTRFSTRLCKNADGTLSENTEMTLYAPDSVYL